MLCSRASYTGWHKAHKIIKCIFKILVEGAEYMQGDILRTDVLCVPVWRKYMLTVEEATHYFGIGEKKIRSLIAENIGTEFCFTIQIGSRSLINRHKFEEFLNQTTSL